LELTIRNFKTLLGIFVKKPGAPAEPEDMIASRAVATDHRHQKMFKEEGATELASIGLKYGPQKKDLLTEWKKSNRDQRYWEAMGKKLGLPKNATSARKLRLMVTLQGVAKKMHKKNQSLWVKNCGRGVSRTLGPVMWLAYYGIIQKDE
jgi:hypothetical protein